MVVTTGAEPRIRLRVQRRERDFQAVIVGGPHDRLWAAGKSSTEAIGDLVRSHPDAFGVAIDYESDAPKPGLSKAGRP
jgi:hypothetical protein